MAIRKLTKEHLRKIIKEELQKEVIKKPSKTPITKKAGSILRALANISLQAHRSYSEDYFGSIYQSVKTSEYYDSIFMTLEKELKQFQSQDIESLRKAIQSGVLYKLIKSDLPKAKEIKDLCELIDGMIDIIVEENRLL